MYPVIVSVGPFTLYSFGFFVFLGFLLSVFVAWRIGRKVNIPDEKILDTSIYIGTIGFILSRIFYVFLHFEKFGFEVGKWILFLRYPGFSLIGFSIGSLLAIILSSHLVKVQRMLLLDVFALSFVVGKFFGDLGAFLNGSDVGTKTSLFFATVAPGFDGGRHPVAIYDAFGVLLIFLFCLALFKRNQTRGGVFAVFLLLYGVLSFGLEFFREDSLYLAKVKFGHIGSLVLVISSIIIIFGTQKIGVRKRILILKEKFISIKSFFLNLISGIYIKFFRKVRILLSRIKKNEKNL